MKFTSIFFTASAENFRAQAQKLKAENKKKRQNKEIIGRCHTPFSETQKAARQNINHKLIKIRRHLIYFKLFSLSLHLRK